LLLSLFVALALCCLRRLLSSLTVVHTAAILSNKPPGRAPWVTKTGEAQFGLVMMTEIATL